MESPGLQLTYAGFNYLDRTLALQLGEVRPEGIDLRFVTIPEVGALFRRMARYQEFDVSEMSLSTLMAMESRGVDLLVGIPVFPSRSFRHGFIFVHGDSPLATPADLRGARVGIGEPQATVFVWLRSFLQHDYGIAPTEVTWVIGGLDTPAPPGRPHFDPPPGVTFEPAPEGATLESLLLDRSIDAAMGPERLHPFRESGGRVRRLIPDHERVEREFFARTGFFPIMHTVAMRRDVYEADRWIARSLMDAFQASKVAGMESLRSASASALALPWLEDELDDLDRNFGGDLFPIGLEPNRPILEAMTRYAHEQGISKLNLKPEDLFAPETWGYMP